MEKVQGVGWRRWRNSGTHEVYRPEIRRRRRAGMWNLRRGAVRAWTAGERQSAVWIDCRNTYGWVLRPLDGTGYEIMRWNGAWLKRDEITLKSSLFDLVPDLLAVDGDLLEVGGQLVKLLGVDRDGEVVVVVSESGLRGDLPQVFFKLLWGAYREVAEEDGELREFVVSDLDVDLTALLRFALVHGASFTLLRPSVISIIGSTSVLDFLPPLDFILTEISRVGKCAYDRAFKFAERIDDILDLRDWDKHLNGDSFIAWTDDRVAIKIKGKFEIVTLRVFQDFVVSHFFEPLDLPAADEELNLVFFVVSV